MDAALSDLVVPVLREKGFKGSLPHFRRARPGVVDLLTFQFDKWGGGFVIEISRCSDKGVTTHSGEQIPPNKVTAWDLHPDKRQRIQPREGSGTEDWFRFDGSFPPRAFRAKRAAKQVLECLPRAEEWWAREA